MVSKPLQRVFGVILMIVGAVFTFDAWKTVMVDGLYRPKAAFFFPLFVFAGLAVALYPVSKEECLERYGVEKPQSWSHFTAAQKTLIIIGIFAGALNWALISGTLNL